MIRGSDPKKLGFYIGFGWETQTQKNPKIKTQKNPKIHEIQT
jgi:hypothetical protein